MAWKIEWSRDAAKAIIKLGPEHAKRIISKIEQSASDPRKHFSRLMGREHCKLRVGNFRVIALLLEHKKVLFMENLGHRKNSYE